MRNRVFAFLENWDLRIDATIFEKAKVEPTSQGDQFYEEAWYDHLRYVAPRVAASTDELFVTGASVGEKKKLRSLYNAVNGVVSRVTPTPTFRTAYWSAGSDPCLQIADYCCWAIQRKWEDYDTRSYRLIVDKVQSEYDFFKDRVTTYY